MQNFKVFHSQCGAVKVGRIRFLFIILARISRNSFYSLNGSHDTCQSAKNSTRVNLVRFALSSLADVCTPTF